MARSLLRRASSGNASPKSGAPLAITRRLRLPRERLETNRRPPAKLLLPSTKLVVAFVNRHGDFCEVAAPGVGFQAMNQIFLVIIHL